MLNLERGLTAEQTIKEIKSSETHRKASRLLIVEILYWMDRQRCKNGRIEISDASTHKVSAVNKADRRILFWRWHASS